MPSYRLRGEMPRKRHIPSRGNGALFTEEIVGLDGFSGNESILYHLRSPFSSRKAVKAGSVALHPSGIPHGPRPGLAERSQGMAEAHELAVMCDTFRPLRLTVFARELDDQTHAYVGREEPGEAATTEDPAGVSSHL